VLLTLKTFYNMLCQSIVTHLSIKKFRQISINIFLKKITLTEKKFKINNTNTI